MKTTRYPRALLTLAGLGLATTLHAYPASTDYVDQHIQAALNTAIGQINTSTNTLRGEINQSTNTLREEINAVRLKPHAIGEHYQGGVVFWVDESGQHGLIAALIDANHGLGVTWQNGPSGDRVTNARANGIYAGLINTQLIIAEQTIDDQEGSGFAALRATQFTVQADGRTLCSDPINACYGNWYLPSLAELSLLKTNLSPLGLGDLDSGPYWTSTEINVNEAYALDGTSGQATLTDKSNASLKIRPIHAF